MNTIPLFDGVPELSISVPIGRSFTYFYRPHDPGTYMYHCHFEDVEHVQMGMTGLLFVRPSQNGRAITYTDPSTGVPRTYTKFAYNCADGSTGYDREFGLFLTEIFAEGHYRDAHIQTTDWTDFKASFWCINGRSYPDTLAPNADVDPVTTRSVTVSGATAITSTRRVTLTFTPALATPVAAGSSISVSGFPGAAAAYNVSNATVISSTATTVTYPPTPRGSCRHQSRVGWPRWDPSSADRPHARARFRPAKHRGHGPAEVAAPVGAGPVPAG